jgi:beta-barrel assembly-enhancing protease
MYEGRFFDGKTAAERRVQVRFSDTAVHIEGDDIALEWPKGQVDVDHRHGGHQLTSSADIDARLVLPDTFDIRMELKRHGLSASKRQARRTLKIAGALLVATLVFLGLIFVAMPLAAEPLAQRTSPELEEQFGANLERQIQFWMQPCDNTATADAAIAPLAERLAATGDLPFEVKLSFVDTPMPNAFTLPGGRVLVTRGLVETLDNPDELAAVLAHEYGHVHARDSMVGLYRNMGLGIFLEAVTGGSGVAQQLVLLGGQLAELRFTRAQEERADAFALRLMADAGYNPEALARAFEAIDARAEELRESDVEVDVPDWMLTHPNIDARIAAARAAATPARGEALSADEWNSIRAACAAEVDDATP